MKIATRFLIAELLWAGAIMVLIVPITLLSGQDNMQTVQIMRWLGHSFALAALPAGIAVANDVHNAPGTALPPLLLVVSLMAFMVWALLGIVGPAVSPDDPDFFRMLATMRASEGSWIAYNHTAWLLMMTVSETISTFLYAGIGVQLGIWATRAFTPAVRRLLYWAVAVGLLISSFAVTDTLYEKVVVHTNGPVEFAGLIGMLMPLGLCFGLMLPTVGLLKQNAPA